MMNPVREVESSRLLNYTGLARPGSRRAKTLGFAWLVLAVTTAGVSQAQQDQPAGRVMLGVRFEGDSSVVSFIKPNGPAFRAGLQVGDEIFSIDNNYVLQSRDLVRALQEKQTGDVVKVEVRRDREYKYFDLTVMIATQDGQRVAADGSILPPPPKFGMVGERPPELILSEWHGLPEGQTRIRLADLEGKVVFLLLFQTTCQFSRTDALPLMTQWFARYKDDPDVQFLAIQNSLPRMEENTLENAVAMFSSSDLPIPIGNDSGLDGESTVCQSFKSPGTPWIILLDRTGVVQFNGLPEELSNSESIELLKLGKSLGFASVNEFEESGSTESTAMNEVD